MRIAIVILTTIFPVVIPFPQNDDRPPLVTIELEKSFTDTVGFQTVGSKVSFRCISVLSSPKFPHVMIEFIRDHRLLQATHNDTFKINRLKLSDSGNYMCRVTIPKIGILNSTHPYPLHVFKNTDDPRYKPMPVAVITEATLQDDIDLSNTNRLKTAVLKCAVHFNISRIISFTFLFKNREDTTFNTDSSYEYHKVSRTGQNYPGNYSCRANTHHGPIYSNDTLIVPEKEVDLMITDGNTFRSSEYSILVHKKQKIITEGSYMRLFCKITTAPNLIIPEKSIEWFLNDEKLRINKNYPWRMAQVGDFLSFDGGITKNYSGIYRCQTNTTNNGLVKSWNQIHVKVEAKKPKVSICVGNMGKKIKTGPKLAYDEKQAVYVVKENDNVFFTCDIELPADNSIVTRVTWAFWGEDLVPSDEVDILFNPPMLILPRIKRLYNGYFTCNVKTSEGGEQTSDPITINFEDGQDNLNTSIVAAELLHNIKFIYENQSIVMMYCHVHPDIIRDEALNATENINWILDGRILKDGKQRDDSETYMKCSGPLLQIFNITDEFMGNYACQIRLKNIVSMSAPVRLSEMKYKQARLPHSHIYSATYPLLRRHKRPERRESDVPAVFARQQNDPDNTYENEFVYIHCTVFPTTLEVSRILWFRDITKSNETVKAYHKLDFFTDNYYRVSNRTLILPKIDKENVASYACLADTDYGSILSEFTPVEILNTTRSGWPHFDAGEVQAEAYFEDDNPMPISRLIVKEYTDKFRMKCGFQFDFRTEIEETRWYFNNLRMNPTNAIEFNENNSTVSFNGAELADTGDYFCEISSHIGIVRSQTIYLDVEALPLEVNEEVTVSSPISTKAPRMGSHGLFGYGGGWTKKPVIIK